MTALAAAFHRRNSANSCGSFPTPCAIRFAWRSKGGAAQGKRPDWLAAASDIRFLDHEGSEETVVHFEAPRLGDAAEVLYRQQEIWPSRPNPSDTGFDLLGDVVSDIAAANGDSDHFDPPTAATAPAVPAHAGRPVHRNRHHQSPLRPAPSRSDFADHDGDGRGISRRNSRGKPSACRRQSRHDPSQHPVVRNSLGHGGRSSRGAARREHRSGQTYAQLPSSAAGQGCLSSIRDDYCGLTPIV